jgi:hypothetical protein
MPTIAPLAHRWPFFLIAVQRRNPLGPPVGLPSGISGATDVTLPNDAGASASID